MAIACACCKEETAPTVKTSPYNRIEMPLDAKPCPDRTWQLGRAKRSDPLAPDSGRPADPRSCPSESKKSKMPTVGAMESDVHWAHSCGVDR